MNIRYLGQNGFLFDMNGKTILVDPFISGNPLAEDIDIDSIKPEYILVTHGHQDHVLDVEQIAKANGSTIISNYEIVSWFGQKEIKGHPMNHGGQWKFDFGTVKYVNAVHSSVLPDGTYGGNPGGFVIWDASTCFYIAGDTALTWDMKLIPMTCPSLDFAILPIGDNFTMGIDDAVICCDFIECNTIIGCHYDTFGFIEIDHTEAKKKFELSGKTLHLLDVGKSIDI
jgi:L-ascorbate metabolism protein UlaG (beta-lactamase superfamily)